MITFLTLDTDPAAPPSSANDMMHTLSNIGSTTQASTPPAWETAAQSSGSTDVGFTIFLYVGFALVVGWIWLNIWGKRNERRIARTPQYEAMYRRMLSEHWRGQGFGIYPVPIEQLRGPSDMYWRAAVAAVDKVANAQARVDGTAAAAQRRGYANGFAAGSLWDRK